MPISKEHLLGVRVTAELLGAIDDEVERTRAARPGCNISRSDCVRELLWQILKQRQAPVAGTRKQSNE